MWKWGTLLSGFFLSLALNAQTTIPATNSPSKRSGPDTSKALSSTADLSLDSARRWTEAALTDSSNLLPLERDILFIRLAAAWKEVDHPKAEDYLSAGLDDFENKLNTENSDSRNAPKFVSMASQFISSDVMEVDRKAWNELMDRVTPRDASEAITLQAEDLAIDDDVAGAVELEKKSLSLGGSERDYLVVESLVESDSSAASHLFDQLLSVATSPNSHPMLFPELVTHVFEEEQDDETLRSFYNRDRQQRILDLLAQKAIAGKQQNDCYYAAIADPLLSHFESARQGELRSIVKDCLWRLGGKTRDEDEQLKTTDDIVRAMNETSELNRKWQLRQQAIRRAAQVDKDYGKAIQLCLDLSQRERTPMSGGLSFDEEAVMYARLGIRGALNDKDNREFERLLNLLPPRLRPELELEVVRSLAKEDKAQALLLLAHARSTLEQETPMRDEVYNAMLRESASIAPQDLNPAWRVMVRGLNRFDQTQRTKLQTQPQSAEAARAASLWKDPLYAWFMPTTAIDDETFVRACVEELDSPEYRARFRVGIISVFLSRYSEALKKTPAKSSNSVTAVKN